MSEHRPHEQAETGGSFDAAQAGRDEQYASVLLDHLARDCDRYRQSRDWGPILLWMAEEVRRRAGDLRVPGETSRRMREQAQQAQTLVLRASA